MRNISLVYKICDEGAWQEAERGGLFAGSSADIADGFIHFSTADQLPETARRHFSGVTGLVLVAVPAEALGPQLRWERSRRGQWFPHFYGVLPTWLASWVQPLPLDSNGQHRFPALEGQGEGL
jgi:uncharacterized protein (DUF952 family)